MKSIGFVALLYMFIALTCVGVSTWSTYYGFVSMLERLALPVALVVAAGLLACDIVILDFRRKGQSIVGVVFVLFIFAAASSASNFNYFFTNFMRENVVSARLTQASQKFDENMRHAEIAVRRESALGRVKDGIEQELRNLADEVRDPRNKGFGEKALRHVNSIYALMPKPIAQMKLPPLNAGFEENEKALAEFQKRIVENLKAQTAMDPFMRTLSIIEEKKSQQAKLVRTIADPGGHQVGFRAKIEAVKALEEDTKLLERTVKQTFAEQGKKIDLDLNPTSAVGIELDNIPDSIRFGFVEPLDVRVTIMAAAAAFLIDFIPLFVAVFLIRRPKVDTMADDERTGGVREVRRLRPDVLNPRQ